MNSVARPAAFARDLADWLDARAANLDESAERADEILPRLAQAGVIGAGVPAALGGQGGELFDAIEAIAAASEQSLAAGFVLWGQRVYVEYLLQSTNFVLREMLLSSLLDGRLAGATGLSNAMKFLAGLEELQVKANPVEGALVLDGRLPWVTNLRPGAFHVAAAVARADGAPAFVASIAHDDAGLTRTEDLDLMALRGTNTAALRFSDVRIGPERVIHPDANAWLPAVRPAFLGMQCGMSIGLARRSLAEARLASGSGRSALAGPIAELTSALVEQERLLRDDLRSGAFRSAPAALFRIRIALAEIVACAVGLELQGGGGKAYLRGSGDGFARRWREAAFIPVITPSLVQLKTALETQRQSAA